MQSKLNSNAVTQIVSCRDDGTSLFGVLIDPDAQTPLECSAKSECCASKGVDFILVGGTRLGIGSMPRTIEAVVKASNLPVIIVPGIDEPSRIFCKGAIGFFCPIIVGAKSLELAGGWHLRASKYVTSMNIQSIPVGYVVVESGGSTEVERVVGLPIHHRDDIAKSITTAVTAEMMGAHTIYLEAGSGATYPIDIDMIQAVRESTAIPMIVGGGLRSPEEISERVKAGADIVIVGNVLEEKWDEMLLEEMVNAVAIGAKKNKAQAK